jgi:hypothetical protein
VEYTKTGYETISIECTITVIPQTGLGSVHEDSISKSYDEEYTLALTVDTSYVGT